MVVCVEEAPLTLGASFSHRGPEWQSRRNDGRVTKLNDNGTINVEIETRNGPVQVVSAKAVETLELDPVWSFP